MGRYILSDDAKADIAEIVEFIEQDNPTAAARVRDQLQLAMQQLADLPGMVHQRDDLAPKTLRFWRVYNYLIIYDPEPKPLPIVRVLHSARDVQAILEPQ